MTESASPNPIQQILRHSNEKTKVKFTVEIEEREQEGKTGYRIDIWKAQANDTATQRCPDNTQGQRGSLRPSTPHGIGNPPRNQVDLSYINAMSPFRQAQEQGEQRLIGCGRRDQFYRLTPHMDSDESMRTDPGELSPQRLRDPTIEPTRQGTPLQNSNESQIQNPAALPNREESFPHDNTEVEDIYTAETQIDIRSPELPDNVGGDTMSTNEIENILTEQFYVYTEHSSCAEPNATLSHDCDIPSSPPGNCLFDFLIKIEKLPITAIELRRELLNSSPVVAECGSPHEACEILSSQGEYGDADCIFIFSRTHRKNVCVHYHLGETVQYLHYKQDETGKFIHLHLIGKHFTPYQHINEREGSEASPDTLRDIQAADREDDPAQGPVDALAETESSPAVASIRHGGALTRYLTADARPSYTSPPWAREEASQDNFMAVQQLDEHPFAYRENLVYVLSTDLFLGTEILEALIERSYIIEDELLSTPRSIKEIWITEKNNIKTFGIFLKDHVDNKPIRLDIKQAIKTLKQLLVKFDIKSVGIIKVLGMLSISDWNFVIEQINKTFKGMQISILFFRNNLPVPKVEEIYRLIKEYHESAIGGHKSITKPYDKLAYEYYWRNM